MAGLDSTDESGQDLAPLRREKSAETSGRLREQIVSYAALDRSTDVLARWLMRQGLETGDRVAIHWCNSIEVVNLYFACFKSGLIAVPVNNRLKPSEIAYILTHSKAKLCFSQPELAPLCEEVRGECPDLQHLYTALPQFDVPES
jgi:acyl-CoA synthetase (AMP-forming)/AMP-acid ligase II